MSDYLIRETTLTRMADKVRTLSGETEQLTPEQMIDLLGIQRDYFLDCINFLAENGANVPENPTMAQIVEIMETLQISSVGKIPKFTYVTSDGSSGGFSMFTENSEDPNDETVNYQIKFFKSGTLTFTQDPGQIDIFMVGGGGGGGPYNHGAGGGGGYTLTVTQTPIVGDSYEIIIGAGGAAGANGGSTTAFGISVEGGGAGGTSGGSGGSGGGGSGATGRHNVHPWTERKGGNGGTDGADGAPGTYRHYGSGSLDDIEDTAYAGGAGQKSQGKGGTTRAFGETTGELYAGGGAGSASDATYTYSGIAGSVTTNSGNNTGRGGNANSAGLPGIVIIRNSRTVS